jgi:ferredoxin, 2Fe-2S
MDCILQKDTRFSESVNLVRILDLRIKNGLKLYTLLTFAPQSKKMYNITFNFEQKGLEPVTLTGVEADQNLLEVALKNNIELHHNCGGVCACSTCHLYINSGEQFVEELSDKEEDFIDRAVNPRLNSRLGCQCQLLSGSGDIAVTLPDQTQFLGE